mgnify:CR=1 FL=1
MNWSSLLHSDPTTASHTRSPFDKDFDRIIFSHPFRKLQDKTQVHPLPEQDFVHNRLTHSLEVSSVARSLGREVGETLLKNNKSLSEHISAHDIGVIVASAALAHDIGNPPFGHSGETAITNYFIEHPYLEAHFSEAEWHDLLRFEGNAQGFRLLNKAGYQGLKLTEATLAAFTKYPRPALAKKTFEGRQSQKKYGFYQTEADAFQQLAQKLGLKQIAPQQWCRHPLAFLVEAADDICYHFIDLEDGCNLGLISHEETIALYAAVLGEGFKPEKLKKIKHRKEQIATLRALAINHMVKTCVAIFINHEEELLSGEFDQALISKSENHENLKKIKSLSIEKIYQSRSVIEIEASGFHIIHGLLDTFLPIITDDKITVKHHVCSRLLPEDITFDMKEAPTTYAKVRALLDFISGMTDRNAMMLYRKINGISLPGMA